MLNDQVYSNRIINGPNLYYFAFTYRLFLAFIAMTNFTPIISVNLMNRLSYLAILLLLAKIYYFDNPKLADFVKVSLVIIIAIVSWRESRAVDILLYSLFIVGAKNVDFKRLMQLFVGSLCILLAYTILISQIGIIRDSIYQRGTFNRHSLGIGYPTDLVAYFFYFCLGYCYLFFTKLTWRSYALIIIGALLLYSVTQARTDAAMMIVLVPVIWIAKQAYNNKRPAQVVASFYWIIPAILSYAILLISYLYTDSYHIFRTLNHLMSDRLALSKEALDKYGVSIFGQHVVEHNYGGTSGYKLFYQGGFKYFYIDSSYMRLAVIYGLLIGILLIIVMTYIGFKSIKLHDYCLAAIMLLIGIQCIMEQHLLDVSYNPFLFALLSSNAFRIGNKYTMEDKLNE